MPLTYSRPELELKLRAPLAGGQPGTHEFVRAATVLVGFSDTCDFICTGEQDEVEINAAIVYVNSLGSGFVFIKGGTYSLTATIIIPSIIGLVGAGRGATVLEAHTTFVGANIIQSEDYGTTDTLEIRIENLTVDGNSVAAPATGIRLRTSHAYLCNVNVTTVTGDGIQFDTLGAGTPAAMVDKCHFRDNTQYGLVMNGGDSHFTDCTFAGNTGDGAQVLSSANHFIGCHAYLNGAAGFSVGNNNQNMFTNCDIENNTGPGVYAVGDETIWSGCRFSLNGTHGFEGNGCNDNTFTGCVFYDNPTTGLLLYGDSDNNHARGNTFVDETLGVHVSAGTCNDNWIAGNMYDNCTTKVTDVGTDTILTAEETYRRVIFPEAGLDATSTITTTTERVYLTPVEVKIPCYVDRIFVSYGGTSAGNLNAGIYYGVAGADPDTGALIVQSGVVAKAAAWNQQLITIAETYLAPGLYYIAYQSSEATTVLNIITSNITVSGIPRRRTYDPGAFTLTAPCPATGDNTVPALGLRVSKVGI